VVLAFGEARQPGLPDGRSAAMDCLVTFGGPATLGEDSPLDRKLCVPPFRVVCRFVRGYGRLYGNAIL